MILTSFEALRKEAGLKPVEKKKKKVVCRRCGNEMKQVAENTWVCGRVLTDKEGKPIYDKNGVEKICNYHYIRG